MQVLDRDPLKSVEEALELIQKITDNLDNNDGITWGIAFKKEEEIIGTIGFWKTDKETTLLKLVTCLALNIIKKVLCKRQ